MAEVEHQNNVLGKIRGCSFRTSLATGIEVLIPLNMGDIGSREM